MPVTTTSTSVAAGEGEDSSDRTDLFGWFKPWVRLGSSYISWEEGEELRSHKVMVRTRPGVQLSVLSDGSEHVRFHSNLTCLDERGYYQLKVWPRSTRGYCEDKITLLATLPGGREKLYRIRACVD
ncbi:hypothetical protein H5P28_02250 [Ruficoccus amylovorans]|uniref:Uncharacterized protein n=1 Tax=Ruficoccus amylovorans TaxID=1804625 RepID=A0A842H972_9BACT|nr:hypothetical protein [Ruficoccus amylovorans]MBC2593073.1 hypothetical protein [Ruficoccus amylovorans]